MNISNDGKQRMQRDNIIPQSNSDPHFRGQPQSMTTASGEAKGLQAVLEGLMSPDKGPSAHLCALLRAKIGPDSIL